MPQYTRILCLGDSITYGARTSHGRTYPVILEDRLALNPVKSVCINAGVNGQRSYEIVDRSWSYLGADPWLRVCVCMMGTNDSKPASRTPMNIYLASWERLRQFCELTDTILFACEIIGLDPTGQPEYDVRSIDWVEHANQMLTEWCHQTHTPLITGLYQPFMQEPRVLLADGIHPNNEGNVVIADCVFKAVGQPMPYHDDDSWRAEPRESTVEHQRFGSKF